MWEILWGPHTPFESFEGVANLFPTFSPLTPLLAMAQVATATSTKTTVACAFQLVRRRSLSVSTLLQGMVTGDCEVGSFWRGEDWRISYAHNYSVSLTFSHPTPPLTDFARRKALRPAHHTLLEGGADEHWHSLSSKSIQEALSRCPGTSC